MDSQLDLAVRLRAFAWLAEQADRYGDQIPRRVLSQGFAFRGMRIPLVGPQGIFKPAVLDLPLSITTVGDTYHDQFDGDVLHYAYRRTDPNHRDNRGLREVSRLGLPLAYAFGDQSGYLVTWPVYVTHDDPAQHRFAVQIDAVPFGERDLQMRLMGGEAQAEDAEPRRAYVTSTFQRRLHQRSFRARVLRAYRERCALCRLRHQELLDAAHITPDSDEKGDPVVTNGLALCKLHHAAFDRHFLTVRPDYRIAIQPRILEEQDGPMLVHGLKDLHGQAISLPRNALLYPDRARLEDRYALFLRAG